MRASSNIHTWSVPYPGGARPDPADMMMRVSVYVGRHVHVERVEHAGGDATEAMLAVTLDGPASEPFASTPRRPRRFKVLLAKHHMHVLAEHPDPFTAAVAEGWARVAAKAWKTEVSSP